MGRVGAGSDGAVKKWEVYMIRCGDGSLYTGMTGNLLSRLKRHRASRGARYTKSRGFLSIAWHTEVESQGAALRLEAKLKKLSKKAKEERVLSSNPYLLSYLDSKRDEEAHERLTERYSWSVPTEEALRCIAQLSPIVEMGAGTGYWASLLIEMGADVVAYDRSPATNAPELADLNMWHAETTKSYTNVLRGGPEDLCRHSNRTLLLCWPPRGRMALDCLENWKGNSLVYIGDPNKTADESFQDKLLEDFTLVASTQLPEWVGVLDNMTVWERHNVCK